VSVDLGTNTATRGTETDQILNVENVTGSNSADSIRGGNAANVLQGLAGSDTLFGLDGDDLIVGGTGKDTMTGGAGRDVFDFNSGESGIDANADVISGFDGIGATAGDTIDLRDVYSGTLAFRGTNSFSGIDQVRVVNEGTVSVIEINLSGSTTPEMEIRVEDGATTAAAWIAADFLL
jgi:Ca2+-binding RTX toxin-like protein